ncbi:hypothetical protein F5X98DRAFT_324545 [Xylaria grammica]|nr:hypothetical protein F5X98DRAFT_324545 [Xylaria grammica]
MLVSYMAPVNRQPPTCIRTYNTITIHTPLATHFYSNFIYYLHSFIHSFIYPFIYFFVHQGTQRKRYLYLTPHAYIINIILVMINYYFKVHLPPRRTPPAFPPLLPNSHQHLIFRSPSISMIQLLDQSASIVRR